MAIEDGHVVGEGLAVGVELGDLGEDARPGGGLGLLGVGLGGGDHAGRLLLGVLDGGVGRLLGQQQRALEGGELGLGRGRELRGAGSWDRDEDRCQRRLA